MQYQLTFVYTLNDVHLHVCDTIFLASGKLYKHVALFCENIDLAIVAFFLIIVASGT